MVTVNIIVNNSLSGKTSNAKNFSIDRIIVMNETTESNLRPYRDVTEKIIGMHRTPSPKLAQWNEDFERLPPSPLHCPPFWWNMSSKSSTPWQCWRLEDFTFKNCKWSGCYCPCVCKQKEDKYLVFNCRFPNNCGYHLKKSVQEVRNNSETSIQKHQRNENDMCCFCRIRNNVVDKNCDGNIPDPRCVGQYHQSLLENILGRGTTLELRKTKEEVEKDGNCFMRGYIPGDVHGWKSWSGLIHKDPMPEEYNNSIYPIEISNCDAKTMQIAENWDGKIKNKDSHCRLPPYESCYEDPRFKHGIGTETFNRILNKADKKTLRPSR